MKKEVVVLLAIVVVLLIVAFGSKEVDENYCEVDSDCVPDKCCHASSCTNVANKPDCSESFCTLSCEPGTLDCGQGSCGCVNNKCVANLNE
tara:strand:- start:3447 stop:3719 length:273 start_codon:yes stop_codon:yes gene_type:complete